MSNLSHYFSILQIAKYLRQLMPDTKVSCLPHALPMNWVIFYGLLISLWTVQKGTVIKDVSNAVKEARDQGILFKKDKTAIVHVGLGKVHWLLFSMMIHTSFLMYGFLNHLIWELSLNNCFAVEFSRRRSLWKCWCICECPLACKTCWLEKE